MISVAIATHNEAANMERFLAALKGWVDEIVAVDGSSTDDTVTLLKRAGARVISTTNKKNFHINKELANKAAQGELVLQLDADEIVDQELKRFILATHEWLLAELKAQGVKKPADLQLNPDQPVAWWLKRRNWFMGRFLRKGGQYPDPVIRLHLRDMAHWPQKDVHEQMKVAGPVGWADGHLLHYGNPSLSDYFMKWDRYTSFKATQLQEAGVTISAGNTWRYIVWLPTVTFLSLYGRHRGYVDGMAGLVFALFSGLHHSMAYLKRWELGLKFSKGDG